MKRKSVTLTTFDALLKSTPYFFISLNGREVWRLPVPGGPRIRTLEEAMDAAERALPDGRIKITRLDVPEWIDRPAEQRAVRRASHG